MATTPSTFRLNAGLTTIRLLAYVMLAYGLFYLAMCLGKWYSENVFSSRDDKLEYRIAGDVEIGDFYNQLVVFAILPVILAAALGGLYEALWKKREVKRSANDIKGEEDGASSSSWLKRVHNIVHYKFRPLGTFSPWLTIGEFTVLTLWLFAMAAQLWQGVHNHGGHYYEFAGRCQDDPSSWCNLFTGEPEPTPTQYRLRIVAIFFGLVASCHFGAILIPVSRDSKLWSAVGIPFERAVLYHAIMGHLAFASLFLHAFLFVIHWVWYDGWSHAVHESIHVDPDIRGGIDVPAGWMSFFCAMPMWITSINYVRRKYYSLFKATHWLFIGVFLFGAMHWAPNVVFFLGGLALYTLHVVSRLTAWKRWRVWNRLFGSPDKASPSSAVDVLTKPNYTRLVLRNPKHEEARGGSFVYLSVPGALGTDEAHAITVALRGAPPAASIAKGTDNNSDFFTVYIKNLGKWTGALHLTAKGAEAAGVPKSLLVDVDGFYNQVNSFTSMMAEGVKRVVVIAGGSGFTSFLGFIQDWCAAAAEGRAVPEVHLTFCCRDMAEMELLGESLPSLLASAGGLGNSHFEMSLFCSAKGLESKGPLSVTWPIQPDTSISTEYLKNPWASLSYSLQVIIAGGAGYCGWLLGTYEADRREMLESLHEGSIALTFMIIAIISALIIYAWISSLVEKIWTPQHSSNIQGGNTLEEHKHDLEAFATTATFPVTVGRVSTSDVLSEEAAKAKANGWKTVKVIASGPNALVDAAVADARAIDWQLFETEAFSFEF